MKNLFGSSSLIPLSKIANAPTKSIRILWIIFSTTMLIGLLVCIGLVVQQYCLQQTIFQLDFSGKITSLDNCPSISVCFVEEEVQAMFIQAMKTVLTKQEFDEIASSKNFYRSPPWLSPGISKFFKKITNRLTIIDNVISNSSLEWNSQIAQSHFYRVIHNFTVKFSIFPKSENNVITINVKEQVPHRLRFLCTTFEFENTNADFSWSSMNVIVENELDTFITKTKSNGERIQKKLKGYKVIFIIHEKGSLPYSAYDRHITETVSEGKELTMFISKSITKRLNTKRNPCRLTSKIELFGNQYEYGHDTCGWKICCQNTLKMCNCTCEIDVLAHSLQPCPNDCMKQVCLSQVSYDICPSSCTVAKYNKYNMIEEKREPHINKIKLIKSDNVHLATEEELYTLTKLCSEIGGLCSLFIGFSCIFLFEIIEAFIIWKSSAYINDSNTIILSKFLDVSNSPQMNHFLSPRYCNNDPSQTERTDVQNFNFSRTIVLVLCADNYDTEYYFHSEKDVDKMLLHNQLRLGRVKIKLI